MAPQAKDAEKVEQMTNGMTVEIARGIIDTNAEVIETFVKNYLQDMGIGIHLVRAIVQAEYNITAEDAQSLLKTANIDITNNDNFVAGIIGGAPSLKLLVQYAMRVDEAVLPRHIIPSDKVVSAALVLFHDAKKKVTVS